MTRIAETRKEALDVVREPAVVLLIVEEVVVDGVIIAMVMLLVGTVV